MTLRISMKEGEKVIVNGAVMRAAGRARLVLESRAAILRGRDVMDEKEATTPARRLYFHTMMTYIEPDGAAGHQDRLITALRDLTDNLRSDEACLAVTRFARLAATMDYYRALAECRTLIQLEDAALPRAA